MTIDHRASSYWCDSLQERREVTRAAGDHRVPEVRDDPRTEPLSCPSYASSARDQEVIMFRGS